MNKMIDVTGIESIIFSDTFFHLTISGVWIPTTMKHPLSKLCFSLFSIFVLTVMAFFVFGSLMDMIVPRDDMLSHILRNWCLTAIVSHTFINSVNVTIKRRQIIDLLRTKVLVERWTCLQDAEEVKIIETSKINEQKVFRYWMAIISVNALLAILTPIVGYNPDNNLVWDSWQPCDVRVSSCYWMCYWQQVFSYIVTSIAHVAAGTLTLNFMERICSHIRILQHRLMLLPDLVRTGVLCTAEDELFYLNECIHDHQNIYSTTVEISRIFYPVIFMHFVLIFSILCTNIYLLSNQPVHSFHFLAGSIFLCCMMSQFFLFCWLGYKVTYTSNEISYTIYSINWLELQTETRKRLRFIMLSASRNIPLFNNFIVELSPEMFLKMLKISYSAFNLLQTQS